MVWQDIYGSMGDDCARAAKTTSSRRGKVKTISFVVNSNSVGTPVQVFVSAMNTEKEQSIYKIKTKIQEWKNKEASTQNKDNMIKYWESKLQRAEEYNNKLKEQNKVQVIVNFPVLHKDNIKDEELLVFFEGSRLTISDLNNLKNNQLKFRNFLDDLKTGN